MIQQQVLLMHRKQRLLMQKSNVVLQSRRKGQGRERVKTMMIPPRISLVGNSLRASILSKIKMRKKRHIRSKLEFASYANW